jgi:hypothetical protein
VILRSTSYSDPATNVVCDTMILASIMVGVALLPAWLVYALWTRRS